MFTLVLSGNNEAKDEFLQNFVKDKKIASYNIYKFSESLKISDAREIKKILSLESVGGDRLVVVGDEPSIESQNALLKTIEELPEDTFFIFLSDKLLLPTIISRVKVIGLGDFKVPDINAVNLNLSDYSVPDSLLIVDRAFAANSNDPYSALILTIRNKILAALSENNIKEVYANLIVIKKLLSHFSLVKFNNLNPRNAAERALIEAK